MKRSTLAAHRSRVDRLARQLQTSAAVGGLSRADHTPRGLSDRQLHRVFKRLLGESPAGYRRRLQLERMAVRLFSAHDRILDLALDAGFESHAAFTRAFQRHFGCTPSHFRRLKMRSLQPGSRQELWRFVATSGLRPYVERTHTGS